MDVFLSLYAIDMGLTAGTRVIDAPVELEEYAWHGWRKDARDRMPTETVERVDFMAGYTLGWEMDNSAVLPLVGFCALCFMRRSFRERESKLH